MAANLTTITNVSTQVVPVLVGTIGSSDVVSGSDVGRTKSGSVSIPPGAQLDIETQRVDVGQLDQLRNLGLITYTAR